MHRDWTNHSSTFPSRSRRSWHQPAALDEHDVDVHIAIGCLKTPLTAQLETRGFNRSLKWITIPSLQLVVRVGECESENLKLANCYSIWISPNSTDTNAVKEATVSVQAISSSNTIHIQQIAWIYQFRYGKASSEGALFTLLIEQKHEASAVTLA